MSRQIRVGLLMHSTRSDNLGVGALTVAQVDLLRELAAEMELRLAVRVIDFKGLRDPYVTGPDIEILEIDRRFLLSPSGLYAALRGCDLVLDIGAGDSFADIYGPKRFRRLMLMKALTHLAGRPLVVAPQTIGPFTRFLSKRMARWTLRRSALVAVRDPASKAAAEALGLRAPITLASDLALRLPYTPAQHIDNTVKVGINVSGLLMIGGYGGRDDYGLGLDYPSLMRALIEGFLARGAQVHLVAHVLAAEGGAFAEDDRPACEALHAAYPQTILAPAFASPSEAKSYISGLDFFTGARMHACIAAFSSGVAVVPMAYSRKFAGLFGALGYPYTLDCAALSAEEIAEKLFAAFADRARIAAEAKAAHGRGLARLRPYRDALKGLIMLACDGK